MNYIAKIYDTNMNELARLENVFNASYELTLNALWTCEFSLPKEDKKNKYCEAFNYVELFDNGQRVELFQILPSTLFREDTAYITYQCEHVLSTLLDNVMFQYHEVGGLGVYTKNVLRYILDKQQDVKWQLVECDFERQFQYKFENENLLSALFSVPKCLAEDYIWRFDTEHYPWGISLKKIDKICKADIQYRKNLQGIEKKVDPTNIITRIYPLGYGEGDNQLTIKSVNNSIPYLERNVGKYGLKEHVLVDRRFENPLTLMEYAKSILKKMSEPYVCYDVSVVDLSVSNPSKYAKFRPGDYVLIKDSEDDIDVILPIIAVKKSDISGNPFDIDIEISNKQKNISSAINDLAQRTRINETYSQGATNLMQMNYNDNADSNNPAVFKFFIPNEMARINKLILNYSLDRFRAYSKSIKGGGARVQTTSSAGGAYISSESGGGQFSTTSSGGGRLVTSEGGGGINEGATGYNQTINYTYINTRPGGNPSHTHEVQVEDRHIHRLNLNDHTHDVRIPSHSHDFEIESHSHRVNIPSHTHEISLPDHTHEIEYGIYQSTKADRATLKVDGISVDVNSEEVDIIPHLSKDEGGKIQRGTWHTVEIIPDKLTRINASLFIQLFTNSRGGGDF